MPYREIADFRQIRLESAAFILTVRNMFSLQFAPLKGVDMRIIRTIIVLSGVAAFMPSAPEDVNQAAPSVASADISDTGYLEVATNTFSDLASFCARQPGVCETAGFVAHKLELKAKYGVRLIYDWASEASTRFRRSARDRQQQRSHRDGFNEAGCGQQAAQELPVNASPG